MLYIEIYESNSGAFVKEIDVSEFRQLINKVSARETKDLTYSNPYPISKIMYLALLKIIPELVNEEYNNRFEWFLQDRV